MNYKLKKVEANMSLNAHACMEPKLVLLYVHNSTDMYHVIVVIQYIH